MKTYTIIGIYADNMQRHSTTVQGKSPADAQREYARIMNCKMLIAGVIEGRVKCVDTEESAEWPCINPKQPHVG